MAQLYLRHSRSRTHGSTCYEISAKFANEKTPGHCPGFCFDRRNASAYELRVALVMRFALLPKRTSDLGRGRTGGIMLALLYLLHSRSRTHGSTCYEISAKFANKKPRDIARGFVLIEETRQPTSCALPSLCVLRYFPNGLLLPLASSTKHRK